MGWHGILNVLFGFRVWDPSSERLSGQALDRLPSEKIIIGEDMNLGIKSVYIFAILIIIGLVVIYVATNYAASPVVAPGDTINVTYTGAFTNGTVFDSNVGKSPLQFTVGSGQVIPGFDNGVIGMKVNEERTITIPANEAYGEINPALITVVPLATFGNQTVKVGMGVGKTVNGQQISGVITAVNKTDATIDFNPPLAGKTLVFNITILSIKKG